MNIFYSDSKTDLKLQFDCCIKFQLFAGAQDIVTILMAVCRISRKDRIRNVTIRQQIGLEETIIKEIEQNQLIWYGHIQRMAGERLPKIALKWMPKQKRARGRPKKNWMRGIKKAMNERNLNEGQWEDRKQWSLDVGQCRKTF